MVNVHKGIEIIEKRLLIKILFQLTQDEPNSHQLNIVHVQVCTPNSREVMAILLKNPFMSYMN